MPQRKVRILELARVGKWGLDGSEITRKDIAELVETFAGKRPVIIGHDTTDRAPKFGDVLDGWLSTDGNSLVGAVMFGEAADKLYENGSYDGWSVSMPRRETDNKRVLHHLAILGAVPPKIPGLAELAQVAVSFSEEAGKNMYQFSGKIPEKEDEEMTLDEALKALAEKDVKLAEFEEKLKALTEQAAAKQAATEVAAAAAEAAAETEGDGKNFADMQKQINELKAGRRKERLEGFGKGIAEKIPAGIIAKAKTLAEKIEAVEEFDFSDNGKIEKRDALQLLGDIFQSWPQAVKTGTSGINYGDFASSGSGAGSGKEEKPVNWSAAAKKM